MAKRPILSITEIEDKIKQRVISNNKFDIVNFIELFDFSSISVKRANKSFLEGKPFIIKNRVHYEVVESDILLALDEIDQVYKLSKSKPRIIIVSDQEKIAAIDTKTRDTISVYFWEFAGYADFFLVWNGIERVDYQSENPADRKAAERFAKIYDTLSKDNPDADQHAFNLFLIRILFLLFAEDTGIIDKSIFTNILKNRTKEDGSDFNDVIRDLFHILDIPTQDRGNYSEWLRIFPYVNGKLFGEKHINLRFSKESRDLLIDAGELLNWNDINPDILGSMIQAVASVETRHSAGMHYTSVPNIMKVIKPLFLDSLIREYDKLHSRNIENDQKDITDKTRQENRKSILDGLYGLHSRISKIKFFDPACGSGNFLIITYKELRRLEIKILSLINQMEPNDVMPISLIHLDNFFGIELEDFPHEVAKLSLWIAEHQMNQEMKNALPGTIAQLLPLKDSGQIICDNSLRLNWRDVVPYDLSDEVYIMGNPPYLGAKLQSELQKKDLELALEGKINHKKVDYITGWFYKGANYIAGTRNRLAFVSTNSINQGEQVHFIWNPILDLAAISFAYGSFKWGNNAKDNAGVSVVVIGLRSIDIKETAYIYSAQGMQPVVNVSPYLVEGPNIIVSAQRSSISNLPKMVFGSMPRDGGNLILSLDEKNELLEKYSKNKQLYKYIKKYIGSDEFINGDTRFVLWFESNRQFKEVEYIQEIKGRVEKVRQMRLSSTAPSTLEAANTPYLFVQRGERMEAFRRFEENKKNSKQSITQLIIPRVSSEKRRYVPMGFVDSDTVVSDSAMVVYNAPIWLLGLLESRMHMVWLSAIGGKLKTDYRYSATLVYNTFPILNLSTQRKNEIARVMTEILDLREFEGGTLANLYDKDKMPDSLRKKHEELDGIVDRAYRQQKFESDEERLSVMLQLYKEMTANDQ